MLSIYIEAPFAAFRTFAAGWYRPTATFLTPSAAYGLLLNIAGIDSRLREEDGHFPKKHPYNSRADAPPTTLIRPGLPVVKLAIGAPLFKMRRGKPEPLGGADEVYPHVQSVFQQLHDYPVSQKNAAVPLDVTRGNKNKITPVRREFLTDLRAVIAIEADPDTEARIRQGLSTDPPGLEGRPRYGVPFLGDNAFLPDRLEELIGRGPVRWYELIAADSTGGVRERATRLTVLIDRADLSQTTSNLYSPGEPASDPPDAAWTSINPPALPEPLPARSRKGKKP